MPLRGKSSARAHARHRTTGLVRQDSGRYEISAEDALRPGLLFLSAAQLGMPGALAAITNADSSVEFAALDAQAGRLHLALTPAAETSRIQDLERRLRQLFPELELVEYEPERYRGTTVEDIERNARMREQLGRATLLKGNVEIIFPVPTRKPGQRLHRLHETVRPLPRRARQTLARRYRLAELSVFGSAVRTDFRADSDVDVLVRFRRGSRATLAALAGLKRDLETHFGRRVDVVVADQLDEGMRHRIQGDKVRLYGWARSERIPPAASQELRHTGVRSGLSAPAMTT